MIVNTVGTVQSNYTTTLAATGGVPPYSWSTTSGQLPTGLTLETSSGAITGTPSGPGDFSFTVRVQDSNTASSSTKLSINISAVPGPRISSVAPTSGPTDGGTSVTIVGANFRQGATVRFGGQQASSFQAVSSTQIQAVTPAEPGGSTDITVQNPDRQTATAAKKFTFIAPAHGAPDTLTTSWSPASLGVPWASDFAAIATNVINVKTDSRLTVKAAGDGVTDDTSALRDAIRLASSSGGGVVYFPTSDYKIVTPSDPMRGSPLLVPSRVILRGDSSTTSRIFVNDPNAPSETDGTWTWGGIDFQGSSLSGMTDLGVYAVNSSTSSCALLWNRGSTKVNELFFNNLDVHLNNCRSFWVQSTNNLLVQNSHFDSGNSLHSGNVSQDGPIYVANNTFVSFLNNAITYHFGRVHMQNNTSLLMEGNTVTRDAENQDMEDGTAIESGGVELSFGQNVQVLNNVVQTLNAPSAEADDGEAIMTQQSTVQDVLDAGSATSITSTTLTDTSALWASVTASRIAQYPEVVAILTGSGTGEWRTIQGIDTSAKTLVLSQPWSPLPEVGSLYSIFAWTLMNATIQGNTLIGNPNGIVLYDGCYECTVRNNTLTNSRGIILRTADQSLDQSLYPEGRRVHEVAINNEISNNTVSNTTGVYPAYIALDAEAFAPDSYRGMGMLNIQLGSNTVNPYPAEPNNTYPPGGTEIIQEGFFPCFLFGPAAVKAPVTTVFQGVNFWNNFQSSDAAYSSYFLPFATQGCVTASAPSILP